MLDSTQLILSSTTTCFNLTRVPMDQASKTSIRRGDAVLKWRSTCLGFSCAVPLSFSPGNHVLKVLGDTGAQTLEAAETLVMAAPPGVKPDVTKAVPDSVPLAVASHLVDAVGVACGVCDVAACPFSTAAAAPAAAAVMTAGGEVLPPD